MCFFFILFYFIFIIKINQQKGDNKIIGWKRIKWHQSWNLYTYLDKDGFLGGRKNKKYVLRAVSDNGNEFYVIHNCGISIITALVSYVRMFIFVAMCLEEPFFAFGKSFIDNGYFIISCH